MKVYELMKTDLRYQEFAGQARISKIRKIDLPGGHMMAHDTVFTSPEKELMKLFAAAPTMVSACIVVKAQLESTLKKFAPRDENEYQSLKKCIELLDQSIKKALE
jgi:hypothetical protein